MHEKAENTVLQYCKLIRGQNGNETEWMGYLKIKADKCGYIDKYRRLKEQFINGINDNNIMNEIIIELMTLKKDK